MGSNRGDAVPFAEVLPLSSTLALHAGDGVEAPPETDGELKGVMYTNGTLNNHITNKNIAH